MNQRSRDLITLARARALTCAAILFIGFAPTGDLLGNEAHAEPLSTSVATELTDAEVEALCVRLADGDAEAREALAKEGVAIVPRLSPHFAPATPEVRSVIESILRREIRRSLDEEGAVRYQGQFAHLRPRGDRGAEILLDMFGNEDETNDTRNRAATALGDLGGPAQVEALEKIADDFLAEAWVEREAVFLLARFGNRTRVEKRLAALQKIADQPPLEATIPSILAAHGDLAEVHYRITDYKKAIHHYNKKQALLEEMRDRVREELKEPFQAEINLLQYNLACSLALDGRVGEAYGALDRSMASREITIDMVQTDGDLRAVRADARFAQWLKDWQERLRKDAEESSEEN